MINAHQNNINKLFFYLNTWGFQFIMLRVQNQYLPSHLASKDYMNPTGLFFHQNSTRERWAIFDPCHPQMEDPLL